MTDKAEVVARYMIYNNATVRKTAERFGLSKSYVYYLVKEKLHHGLATEVNEVLQKNKAERHIRGGEATRKRWTQS